MVCTHSGADSRGKNPPESISSGNARAFATGPAAFSDGMIAVRARPIALPVIVRSSTAIRTASGWTGVVLPTITA